MLITDIPKERTKANIHKAWSTFLQLLYSNMTAYWNTIGKATRLSATAKLKTKMFVGDRRFLNLIIAVMVKPLNNSSITEINTFKAIQCPYSE